MNERTGSTTLDPAILDDAQRDGVACAVCRADLSRVASVPVGHVAGGQVFACASHADRQGDDAEQCAPWCAHEHVARYHVADEPEGDDCHREIGRLGHADGYGQVVVSVARDYYGMPSIEVAHLTDTGRRVEEMLSVLLLDPAEVARLSELLACAAQMLAGGRDR